VQQKTQLAICLLQIRWLAPSFSRHGRAVRARLCSFGLSKTFRPLAGRTIEPAAVKTGKAATIYVGIVTTAKIPTGSAIRFIEDNAACCHFDTTSDKGI
jgi:hypothetical protein